MINDFLVCFRDLRETRQRFDSMVSELKRKEIILREMQQRLEASEGCKYHVTPLRLMIDCVSG